MMQKSDFVMQGGLQWIKLDEFVNINEFFPTNTKFGDLELALQWTHTDINFIFFMNDIKFVFVW